MGQESEALMPLKTLTQHNKERYESFMTEMSPEPIPNGIACPACGEELVDSDPMSTLTMSPPMKRIHCPKCNFRSTRFA